MAPLAFDLMKFEMMWKEKSKDTYAGSFTECQGEIFETKY